MEVGCFAATAAAMRKPARIEGNCLLLSRAPRCFAGGLDQFLNRGLIFPAGLQEIDPDCAAYRHQRVGRIGVELLEAGDQLEPGDLACRRRLPLSARREGGAWRIGGGGDVDLVQRVDVTLRVADGPEEL